MNAAQARHQIRRQNEGDNTIGFSHGARFVTTFPRLPSVPGRTARLESAHARFLACATSAGNTMVPN